MEDTEYLKGLCIEAARASKTVPVLNTRGSNEMLVRDRNLETRIVIADPFLECW